MNTNTMNIIDTLMFIAGGGIAGSAFYWLTEAWPWFGRIAKRNKMSLFMGLSVTISVAATALLILLGSLPFNLETVLLGVIAGVLAGYKGTHQTVGVAKRMMNK